MRGNRGNALPEVDHAVGQARNSTLPPCDFKYGRTCSKAASTRLSVSTGCRS